MAKVNNSFLIHATAAMFNGSSWTPTGEKMSLKDIWASTNPGLFESIKGNPVVTATRFEDGQIGYRITVSFTNGSSIDLKLSGKSDLIEGDEVDANSIEGIELAKVGQDNIVRYDGKKVSA